MIWFVGIMAIGLMLAVLTIPPEQLMLISGSLMGDGEKGENLGHLGWHLSWVSLSWLLLLLSLVLGLVAFFYQRAWHSGNRSLSEKPHNTDFNNASSKLTPLYMIRQRGLASLGCQTVAIGLFWLAVLSQATGQRLALISITPSPEQALYVSALVTAQGISDKILQLAPSPLPSNDLSSSKPVVIQGYRQLATLTDIRYHQAPLGMASKSTNDSIDPQHSVTANPFTANETDSDILSSNSAGSTRSATTLSSSEAIRSSKPLPASMTVMLGSYKAHDIELNQLAPQQKIRLLLKINGTVPDETQTTGFNEYRWLSTRHAVATAQPIDSVSANDIVPAYQLTPRQRINQARYQLRQHFIDLTAASLLQNPKYAPTIETQESDVNAANQQDAISDDAINDTLNGVTDSSTPNNYTARQQAIAVTLSLLSGDRSLINDETSALYRFAGISHLLAISGTHVLFLALFVAASATFIVNRYGVRLYRYVPRWQVQFLAATGAAFVYALFAGFDIPAARTAWMLVVVAVLRYLLALPAAFKVLLGLAVIMAWFDVMVLWQAGFSLSFMAVAVLLMYSQRWGGSSLELAASNDSQHKMPAQLEVELSVWGRSKSLLWAFFKLQLWMSLALLPVSLWLFGEVSLWGLVVNLFAIALFGWVIVPLNLLAGVCYFASSLTTPLADKIWWFLIGLLEYLHAGLAWWQQSVQQMGWLYTDISPITLLLVFVAVLPWLTPKGMLSRYLAIPALMGLAGLALISQQPHNEAMLVTTGSLKGAISGSILGSTSESSSVSIIVLPISSSKLTATLVMQQSSSSAAHNWLLLSAYDTMYSTKAQTAHRTNQEEIDIANSQAKDINKQLARHKIDTLTGVIVQTATPNTAYVVAQLRRQLPISYYWQAGFNSQPLSQKDKIENILAGTGLSAQSCHSGKYWQAETRAEHDLQLRQDVDTATGISVFAMTVVTGWQEINDPKIWDCTVMIHSTQPIALPSTALLPEALSSTILSSTLLSSEASNKRSAYDAAELLIYSSASPKLGRLWQLLCDVDSNDNNRYETAATAKFKLSGKPWLITPQAYIDYSLIDTLRPQEWYWLPDEQAKPSDTLINSHLYWQQQRASHSVK